MKKKIKTIVFILLSIWVVLGIVARMDLRYLADKYRSDGFDDWVNKEETLHKKYFSFLYEQYLDKYSKENFEISDSLIKDNIIFGFKLDNKMYWLNDDENLKMHDLLIDSYWGNFPLDIGEPVTNVRFYGFFYACPKWANYLGIKNILLPFLPNIHIYYKPLQEHMYICQENNFLEMSFHNGIHITNLPPSLLYLDK